MFYVLDLCAVGTLCMFSYFNKVCVTEWPPIGEWPHIGSIRILHECPGCIGNSVQSVTLASLGEPRDAKL